MCASIEKFKKPVDINKKSISKNILLYQFDDYHTEIAGCFIWYHRNDNIYIYHPHKSSNNHFPYYETLFKKSVVYVSEFQEDKYDKIYMLTSRNIEGMTVKNRNKYVLIKHANNDTCVGYTDISLTPIVDAKHTILPIYDMPYTSINKKNIISLVGNMDNSSARDIKLISDVAKLLADYKINIFTRKISALTQKLFDESKNITVYRNLNSSDMLKMVIESKYLLTADKDYYFKKGIKTGVLTGTIPIGINNTIPIIMSTELNKIYMLKGVIEYKDANDIAVNVKKYNSEYGALISNMIKHKIYLLKQVCDVLHQI